MKFAEYANTGYECFISGKFLNGNAGKVVDMFQQSYISALLSHPNNLPDTKIAGMYNAMGEYHGWEPITAKAVGTWRRKLGAKISAGRLGVSNFRNHLTMQVKRSRPTTPMLMWSLDGWTVELLYQATKTDKKGHSVTTYTNRLTMVVVLDVFNDYPIGYAVGSHESPELIKAALRNAAIHTLELSGEMLRANQVQSDRYAIKTMTDLYAVMGGKVTPAQAHNAKAKPVEPYFNHLNTTYCLLCNNWSGFGITTNPNRQPNSDAEQLERVMNYNKQLETEQARRIALDYHRTEQLIAATPALRGSVEDRLLLTDSRGQHKNQRSRKRLAAADIEALEVETVEVPITAGNSADAAEYKVNDYSIF